MVKTGGGGEETTGRVCGGGYGGAGSYVREEFSFYSSIH